jgi:hypothetical protein
LELHWEIHWRKKEEKQNTLRFPWNKTLRKKKEREQRRTDRNFGIGTLPTRRIQNKETLKAAHPPRSHRRPIPAA